MDPHAKTLRKLPQPIQKFFVTTPVSKNRLSLMPAVDHVIPGVRYFQSGKPSHLPSSHQAAMLRYVPSFKSLRSWLPSCGVYRMMSFFKWPSNHDWTFGQERDPDRIQVFFPRFIFCTEMKINEP